MNLIERLIELDFILQGTAYVKSAHGEFFVITDTSGEEAPTNESLRLFVGVYRSQEEYVSMQAPADSGMLCYRVERAGNRLVLKLDLHHGGPVVAELVWLINERLDGDAVALVARMFSEALREDLTPQDMAEVVKLNHTPSFQMGGCATKLFLDPNVQMTDVLANITGEEVDFNDPTTAALAIEAWKVAKAADFDPDRIGA